jgi:hypothetical protein
MEKNIIPTIFLESTLNKSNTQQEIKLNKFKIIKIKILKKILLIKK